MIKQEQSEKIVYGSLITSTKCYNCIHFPLCFAQKGGANLELASENDCCYYQSKLPEDSVVISREEYEKLKGLLKDANQIKSTALEGLYMSHSDIENIVAQSSKEAVEKFAKDLLSVWDILEKWSEKYYEPHSGITPAHIKEYAKQFGVEIKEYKND